MNKTVVGIAFDDAINKREGKLAAEMLTRLLSRLYPKLNLINLTGKKDAADEYIELAKKINSRIEITKVKPTVIVAVSQKPLSKEYLGSRIFYVGSDKWVAKFSDKKPVGCGNSEVPFAAGAVACVAVSNIFRVVFQDFINEAALDGDFSFSLINLDCSDSNAEIKEIDVQDFILVGFGAIGNGAVWALANTPFIKGTVTIVEPETVDLSNLQRYVLAEERHIDKAKTDIPQVYNKNSNLKINVVPKTWAGFLGEKNNWINSSVLISIDNAKDRIGVQSSLPKKIINSYTAENLIGISRHYAFGEEACVACTYMPTEERKNFALEVAENLGIHRINLPPPFTIEYAMGGYLHGNKGADDQLLGWIASENSIDRAELEKFKDIPVREFYSKFVCGGILMKMKKNDSKAGAVEAPLAFQSALAGILLAAEYVVEKGRLRKSKLPNVSQLWPLAPIKKDINPRSFIFTKDNTGRCICSDKEFIAAYQKKYPAPVKQKSLTH
ncbi:MAG: E2 ligase fold family C protein [Bacteroidetes bacterium]|nr:E2 ligase fold family C protein [Bacteroidota bacterium]